MKLSELLYKVQIKSVFGDINNVEVNKVEFDSREIKSGDLFIAIHGTIVKRVLSTNDEKKWNTIPRTYKEIDDLRVKFGKSKETDKLKMLEEINVYVEELEKFYSHA